eukprot:scaffold14485_cov67-Phaeocystis_antarctica.AAC.3
MKLLPRENEPAVVAPIALATSATETGQNRPEYSASASACANQGRPKRLAQARIACKRAHCKFRRAVGLAACVRQIVCQTHILPAPGRSRAPSQPRWYSSPPSPGGARPRASFRPREGMSYR